MSQPKESLLAAEWIAAEAHVRHHLPQRTAGRDAQLAIESSSLNDAVLAASADLGFDDQPGDFAALLYELRDTEGELR